MKHTSKIILALAIAPLSANLYAEGSWKGAAELGLILTGGNTTTQSTNAKFNITHERKTTRHEASIEALNVKGEEARLSEKYNAKGKSSYKFGERSYAFLSVEGEHDPFSGFAYQTSGTLGYGYSVIKSEKTTLDFEGGPGYRETRVRGEDDSVSETMGQVSGNFTYKLSKTAEFSEKVTIAFGEESTISHSVTALTAQIVGNLAMKTSFSVKNNSNVPDDVDATDYETAMTLVYQF